MTALLSCPFCGGDAVVGAPNMHRRTNVLCKSCGAGGKFDTKENAIAAWNRRTLPDGVKTCGDIIKHHLLAIGADGLCYKDVGGSCGCGFDDLGQYCISMSKCEVAKAHTYAETSDRCIRCGENCNDQCYVPMFATTGERDV